MTGTKLLFLDTLIRLAKREDVSIEGAGIEDIVRACFLFLASPSVDHCAVAERLGYEEYEYERPGVTETVRGLSLPGPQLPLQEMVEGLMDEKSIPPALKDAYPDLTHEDYIAGLWAIRCILYALQWSTYDAQHDPQYSEERTRKFLAKTVLQLNLFRTTGEV